MASVSVVAFLKAEVEVICGPTRFVALIIERKSSSWSSENSTAHSGDTTEIWFYCTCGGTPVKSNRVTVVTPFWCFLNHVSTNRSASAPAICIDLIACNNLIILSVDAAETLIVCSPKAGETTWMARSAGVTKRLNVTFRVTTWRFRSAMGTNWKSWEGSTSCGCSHSELVVDSRIVIELYRFDLACKPIPISDP